MEPKICKICGETFIPKSSRRLMCYKDHFHPCPVCGVPVLTTDLYHQNTCCCTEHSRQLAIKSKSERFPNGYQTEASAEKRRQTNLQKYGSENVMGNAEIREKQHQNILAAMTDECIQKRKDTCLKKYGVDSPMKSKEVQHKIQKHIQEKYHNDSIKSTFQLPEVKAKCDQTNLEKWGTTIPMQNPEVWKRQAVCKKSSIVASDGTPLDSTYEQYVYEYCLRNRIPIKRTPVAIPYEYQEEQHRTFIDFEIDGILVEVKGEHILDGYFDWRDVPIATKIEIYKQNNILVVTGSSHRHLFESSPSTRDADQTLIGVDIELFKNPEFPYRDDRPKCFYDVRVNGQRSMYEAFHDEQLRWEMIKNRRKYVGGFIDAKKVVTGMNVTRQCKQPSWFSKELAIKLIRNYATSDLIVDPFAGWGTRHDAALELHKEYIGIDANEGLVKWHQEKHRNITLGDAKEFHFGDKCTVLTCPPYQDTEIYFDGQDLQLTQCEWLQIAMKNIPNASEYIMVCKDVGAGWEQYIVDEKINKSHFGTNTEYVLVVPGKH